MHAFSARCNARNSLPCYRRRALFDRPQSRAPKNDGRPDACPRSFEVPYRNWQSLFDGKIKVDIVDLLSKNHPESLGVEPCNDLSSTPGVIAVLGELKSGAIITEEGVARLFDRHVASVKRAVQRGELPPPCRLFGKSTWTVGALIRHIENRLEQAADEAQRSARKLAQLSP